MSASAARHMPRVQRSPTGAGKNAAAIVDLCRSELEPVGFIQHKASALWRTTNLKLDILQFDIIPRARCEKWRVPVGSFSLEPSCLFRFLPLLGRAPGDDTIRPEKKYGQIRLMVYRGIPQPSVKPPNIWWAGEEAETLDAVANDVLSQVKSKVVPFFSRFEDPDEVLRTLLEDDQALGPDGVAEGIWDFGKKGSPTRLLYAGFAAIEAEKWDLALSTLRTCREKLMTIPAPVGDQVRAEMMPYVDQGSASVEVRQRWSLPWNVT